MDWINLRHPDAMSRAIRDTPRPIKFPDHTFAFTSAKVSVGRVRLASIYIAFRRLMTISIPVWMRLVVTSTRIIGKLSAQVSLNRYGLFRF